jgi:hypothetical protein
VPFTALPSAFPFLADFVDVPTGQVAQVFGFFSRHLAYLAGNRFRVVHTRRIQFIAPA